MPPGITTANVCRISGKLASEGCQDVEVENNDGIVEHRSMVYTEYFARGTEPDTVCDLHPTRGILTRIAGVFGAGEEKPAPARVEDTGTPPPPPTATTGAGPELPPQTAEPRKKRGFWSRIFGGGRDDDEQQQKPKKKGGN
jgi:hypothetical protein